ncbi:hypothetical protein [Streptodolium elevatio]|uniref:Uncharacterized protein n=1 Tax=Streptodolium elevatio TaxID=3157996 RepID=A0ABV3DDQ1_9ACTN
MPPAYAQQPPPEPPRNARGETPVETERRWLSNISSVLFPVLLAAKLLKPKYLTGRPDAMMDRINRIRAWLGLAIVFGLFLRVFYSKKRAVPNMPVSTTPNAEGLPAPATTPGASSLGDALAAGPPPTMPKATSIPTDLSSLFPSGFPTNFPTRAPSGGVPTGVDPGIQDLQQQADDMMETADKAVQLFSVGQEFVSAVVHRIILAPLFCALGLVVVGLFLVLLAHPSVRSLTLHQLTHPLRAMVVFTAVLAVGITAYVLLRNAAGLKNKTYVLNKDGTQTQLVLSWVSAFLVIWCVLFAVGALWQITKHLFAAADGHPLLLPLLTMWLAWSLTLNDITLELGSGMLNGLAAGSDTVPDNVKAAVAIAGSTVISFLSFWEMSRLQKWNGITFRSGPFAPR